MELVRKLAKKRAVLAVLLAVTSFSVVSGFAATLNARASAFVAGNGRVATCQAGVATARYSIAYDGALHSYKVARIVVKHLGTGCAAKSISVTLTGAADAALSTIVGVVPAGGSLALSPQTTVAAASVSGISVAIDG